MPHKYCCFNFLFTSSYSANCFYPESLWFYEVLTSKCTCKYIVSCCFVPGRYTLIHYHFIGYKTRTFWSVVTCERGSLSSHFDLAFSNPQVTEDVSLGPTTLNRKRHPIEVTVIGLVSSYANLLPFNLFFYQSTNCAVTPPTGPRDFAEIQC